MAILEVKNLGINDGHTIKGPGSGAVGRISESEQTRLIGSEVRRLIKERGHNAINCTVDYANSTSEGLALIVQQANRTDLHWFIAIHLNAGKGRGVEVYTFQGRKYDDAVAVCKAIADLGFTNRGVKEGTGLYVISKTKAKSMLIEVCFVDSDDVDTYLRVGYKAIAKAIVDALCGYVESVPVIDQPTTEGIAYCTVPVLNVRDGAATNNPIQGELNLNEKVTILEKSGDWRKVRYYNAWIKTITEGWVNANYLRIDKDVSLSAEYGIVTATELNVRAGRGASYDKWDTLKQNTKVELGELKNGWYLVYYNGGKASGYVSAKYIKKD